MKKSKYLKCFFFSLACCIVLSIWRFYDKTVKEDELTSILQISKEVVAQSDKQLSNQELIAKIKLLIQDGENVGVKLKNFEEKELYLYNNDELTDLAFDLMFSIECQNEAIQQKNILIHLRMN